MGVRVAGSVSVAVWVDAAVLEAVTLTEPVKVFPAVLVEGRVIGEVPVSVDVCSAV